MSESPIAIRNVYVMMAYAFGAIHSQGHQQLATESFDHLHDLFAEIFVRGVGSQVKRGLHRDYLRKVDELATVRGRINVTRTVSGRTMTRGRLVCEFDEYEADTPHNRALKSVMVLLIRHGHVASPRRDALRRLLPYLDAVTLVAPTSIRWDTLVHHRGTVTYRLMLGVCEMTVRGLLPTQQDGDMKLTSWATDEAMSRLYENFLREYYAFHHPELRPKASHVAWDYDPTGAHRGVEQLPRMITDVTLRKGPRTLIIDAKYYSNPMSVRFDKTSINSGNIYQLLSYVTNSDRHGDGSVSGVLLYAWTKTGQQPNLDVVIGGNRIGARTLNLNRPWVEIAAQLDKIAGWLDRPTGSES